MLCTNLNQRVTLTCMLSPGVSTSVLIITAAVGLQVLYETSLYLVCVVRVTMCVLGKVHLWTQAHTGHLFLFTAWLEGLVKDFHIQHMHCVHLTVNAFQESEM